MSDKTIVKGAATKTWILQWLHHKTDLDTCKLSLPKNNLMEKMAKNFNHISQISRKSISLYNAFVEIYPTLFL
jgi:hypothetical protein